MSVAVINSQSEQIKEHFSKGDRFQDFIEGATNRKASETCKYFVAQSNNLKNKILFLYGSSGLGKTHLVKAVVNSTLEEKPNARVLYITSQQLVNEFATAQEQQNHNNFINKFKNLELLLIDDIQFLSSNLTDFSKTIDQILLESKQTILTSDRNPTEIPEIEPCVTAHFASNQAVEVGKPTLENRVEILLYKAKTWDYDLSNDCALLIAQQNQSNVRELEGDFNKIIATARFKGTTINSDIVNEALR